MKVFLGLARTVRTEIRRVWIRHITISVYGIFRPYPYPYNCTWDLADRNHTAYIRFKSYMDHIWTVFAETQVQFPATAVFALFGQFFLSPLINGALPLLPTFYKCMFFALINSFIGGNGG